MVQKKVHIESVSMNNSISLKNLRKSCGYTQSKIAKMLGITQQQYSRYETNTNKIPLEMFLKILDVCNLHIKIEKGNQKRIN